MAPSSDDTVCTYICSTVVCPTQILPAVFNGLTYYPANRACKGFYIHMTEANEVTLDSRVEYPNVCLNTGSDVIRTPTKTSYVHLL